MLGRQHNGIEGSPSPNEHKIRLDGLDWIIQVPAKLRRKFTVNEDNFLVCLTCYRIRQSKKSYIRADPKDSTSTILPAELGKPHECLLNVLKRVDDLKQRGLIPDKLCDEWMAMNGTGYQLGSSAQCMQLWAELDKIKCTRVQSQHWAKADWSYEKTPISFGKCREHQGFYVKISWDKIREKEDLKLLNEVWRWSSEADHAKTNVSAADMIWHMRNKPWCRKLYDRWNFLFTTNIYNVTATALLIHLTGNPSSTAIFKLLEKRKLCCLDIDDFKNIFKTISVAIRRTGHWDDGREATLEEVTGCASWELAIGRSMNKSDWQEERNKRTAQTIPLGDPLKEGKSEATNNEYVTLLRAALKEIMIELVQRPQNRDSWADFVESRQTWCSSGSTGGKRLKLSSGERIRLNKHAYFESLTKEEMIDWLEVEPVMQATASEKFEMGKARAIYGTQPLDYSISAYVLDGIESRMHRVIGVENGLTDQDFIATIIRRCAAVERAGTECTMLDYVDFNYQHTLEAQAAVFDELASALGRRGYHQDKVQACRWVAKAMMNQKCYFPGLERKNDQIKQGMFSGCRGTNFINTILNTAYFRTAKVWLANHLNLYPIELYNIHQGDDVWISNQSRLWAIALYTVMWATGFIFQPSKQMFDVCRGEFLRVVYTKSGCRGYLGRAISTLIMKPIQNTDIVSPAERAVALNSQIMILARRGLTQEGCELVWDALVPYAARSKLPDGALTIPVSYLTKSYLDNGLDLGYPRTAVGRTNQVASIPVMELGSKQLEKEVPELMARDWANVLSRKLKVPLLYEDIVNAFHKSNVTDSLRSSDRTMCLRALERDLRKWLAKLDCGSVTRTKQAYEDCFEGEREDGKFLAFTKALCLNLLGKTTGKEYGPIDTILRCVGSSPFKSVTNAMTATGESMLRAVEIAMAASTNYSVMLAGFTALNLIRNNCGDEVTMQLLDGVRAGATKYEADYHPTILSWAQTWALNTSVASAIADRVTDRNEMTIRVATDFDKHVRTMADLCKLAQISHY